MCDPPGPCDPSGRLAARARPLAVIRRAGGDDTATALDHSRIGEAARVARSIEYATMPATSAKHNNVRNADACQLAHEFPAIN